MTSIIFGATSGLGWSLAQHLFRCGHNVAVYARRHDRLLALRGATCKDIDENKRLLTFAGDVQNEDTLKTFFDGVIARYKYVDTIYYCAGQYSGSIVGNEEPLWRNIMEVNYWAAYRIIGLLISTYILDSSRCTFIAITSSMSRGFASKSGPYSCSKAALEQMIRSCKYDIPPNKLTIYGIDPGPFRSEMNRTAERDADDVAQDISELTGKEDFRRHGKIIDLRGVK